jgi:acyl-CoA thioesterase I
VTGRAEDIGGRRVGGAHRGGPKLRRRLGIIILGALTLALTLAGCGGSTPATGHFTLPSTASGVTPSPTARPPVVYVAMGASDAVGVGADNPNTQGYVPIIISHLPKGSEALNYGISGILLHEALAEELPQALVANPTLVTVWLVANDFRDCTPLAQYTADLDSLLGQLQRQTHARVFVANTPDLSLLPYFRHGAPGAGGCVAGATTAQVHALVLAWNAAIDPIIARHGDVLVNLFTSDLAQHPEYISAQDGFHPSTQGYARLADLFWTQIVAQHAVPGS